MTDKGIKKLIINIVAVLFLILFFSYHFGIKSAFDFIGLFTNFKVFIIAGLIMFLLNLNEKNWGRFIYGLVLLLLLIFNL